MMRAINDDGGDWNLARPIADELRVEYDVSINTMRLWPILFVILLFTVNSAHSGKEERAGEGAEDPQKSVEEIYSLTLPKPTQILPNGANLQRRNGLLAATCGGVLDEGERRMLMTIWRAVMIGDTVDDGFVPKWLTWKMWDTRWEPGRLRKDMRRSC